MTDFVIVLGNRPDGETPSPEMVKRVKHGVELAQRMGAVIIFSGGRTSGRYSEALLMQRVAEDEFPGLSLPSVLEPESLDTIGNAYYCAKLLSGFGHGGISVVTSPYHLQRSKYIFTRVMGKGVVMQTFGPIPEELQASEQQPFELARLILDRIKPWDTGTLWKRMKEMHPFYSDGLL